MTTGHVQTTQSGRCTVRGGKEHESLRMSKEGSKVSDVQMSVCRLELSNLIKFL